MALTEKMKAFCREYVKQKNAVNAYMTAYDSNSYNSASVESGQLLKRDDIQEFIQTLEKPINEHVQQSVISDRERKRSFLWNVIHDENQTMSDRLKATDLLNKMDSEYIAQTRLECDNKTVISGLDTDALKRLLEKN